MINLIFNTAIITITVLVTGFVSLSAFVFIVSLFADDWKKDE